jgi:SAM-dependent methyltransferase
MSDRAAIQVFMDRWVEILAAGATVGVVALADRTGILAALAEGPGRVEEIADRAGVASRYTAEILSTLTAGGLIRYQDGVFEMPPEAVSVLADEASPYFMGGQADGLRIEMAAMLGLVEAVRTGGGLRPQDYDPDLARNIARVNGPSQRVLLTKRWLPSVPGLVERLQAGCRAAEVGCGAGAASIAMARAYPNSTFVGFDVNAAALTIATGAATGLENLAFEERSVLDLPADSFDFVLAFDVVHDLSDPQGGLMAMRRSLAAGGLVVMAEPKVGPRLEDNLNPWGALMYGTSTLYCLPVALAGGGPGLGTAWGPEKAEELARAAGFEWFEEAPVGNPRQAFYVLA